MYIIFLMKINYSEMQKTDLRSVRETVAGKNQITIKVNTLPDDFVFAAVI
jgi:hypothetical protein